MLENNYKIEQVYKHDEIEELQRLIIESTDAQTLLTVDSLNNALIGKDPRPMEGKIGETKSAIATTDLEEPISSEACCIAYMAQVDNRKVGYVIYHYHYSPWLGHSAYIDDIFVQQEYRLKGVATALLDKIIECCKKHNINRLIFSVPKSQEDTFKKLQDRKKLVWIRNDQIDWSVYRLNF